MCLGITPELQVLECILISIGLSPLYVCMAIKHIIVLFVETPRKFIAAVINLRGVSTNKTIISIGLSWFLASSYNVFNSAVR